jgi:hypothetical protein
VRPTLLRGKLAPAHNTRMCGKLITLALLCSLHSKPLQGRQATNPMLSMRHQGLMHLMCACIYACLNTLHATDWWSKTHQVQQPGNRRCNRLLLWRADCRPTRSGLDPAKSAANKIYGERCATCCLSVALPDVMCVVLLPLKAACVRRHAIMHAERSPQDAALLVHPSNPNH